MSWDVALVEKQSGDQITETINYTHNCNQMVREAGMPEWPYKVHGWSARKLRRRLDVVLAELRANPEKYRAMNPANGWGDYDGLRSQLARLRSDCRDHPRARVWMWA